MERQTQCFRQQGELKKMETDDLIDPHSNEKNQKRQAPTQPENLVKNSDSACMTVSRDREPMAPPSKQLGGWRFQ
jgi:hypothetical protein